MLRSLLSNVADRSYCDGLGEVSQSEISAATQSNQSEAFLVNDGVLRYRSKVGEWCLCAGKVRGNLSNKGVKLDGRGMSFD
jgi:hypothetical protein